MTFQEAILIEAQRHRRSGQLGWAETLCRRILSSDSSHPDALHLLGMVYIQWGRDEEAIRFIERAIGQKKNVAEYYANLAVALQNTGRNAEAMSVSLRALSLHPKNFSAYTTLGNALKEQRRWEAAADSFRKALSIKPDCPEGYFNLGNVFSEQEKFEQAADCYRQALDIKPDLRRAHFHLGHVLRKMSRLDEAAVCYQQFLKFEPDFPEAHFLLGNIYQDQGRFTESIDCYEKAIRLKPDLAEAHKNLGAVLYEFGRFDEALLAYREALRVNPTAGLRIKLATLLPPIVDSIQSMEAVRRKFYENVNELLKEEIFMEDPVKEAGNPNFFYLAYYGQNDRELMTQLARLYRFLPGKLSPRRKKGQSPKTRVGFISRFFHNHSVGTFFNPIIESLSQRGDFEVTMFSIGGRMEEPLPKTTAACHHHIPLSMDLARARQRVSEQSLDILVYTDIGMEPLTYFMAFTRMARVQCVMIGHLMTTGIPNMDFFISSALVEPEEAQNHYSETLIRLKSMPCWMKRPSLPLKPKSRKDFGLPEDRVLYVVPMRLNKLHPDFDPVMADILRQNRKGEILLFKDPRNLWHEFIGERFRRTIPDVLERIRFLPWLNDDDFKSMMLLSDVALDTFHYGGGVTSYILLATGLPIITWPGRYLRGRLTLGCYRKMGVMECVAEHPNQYVDMATRLGTDAEYRKSVREQILAKNGLLYDNEEVVREISEFFKGAIG